MKKLILYLLKKYHSNWDMIYNAICNKDQFDWSEVNNINDQFEYEYMPIVSDNYPNKLKTIYMPPFALFYDGDLNYLNYKVLTIVGVLNQGEVNQLSKIITNDIVICISNNDLTKYFIDMIQKKNIKTIIICEKTIKSFKFEKNKYNNIVLLSEYNNLNFNKSIDQTVERLLYAFADKIFIKNVSRERLSFLNSNYENIPKSFYSLEKNKDNSKLIEIFNKNQLMFIKKIEDISFV